MKAAFLEQERELMLLCQRKIQRNWIYQFQYATLSPKIEDLCDALDGVIYEN